MDLDQTTKALTAIGTALPFVWAAWKWLPASITALKARGMVQGLRKLNAIHCTLARAVASGAERVIIFGGHNSGGIPRVGSPFYVSALHSHSTQTRSQIEDYQHFRVDTAYVAMLLKIIDDKYLRFDCSSTAQDSLLLRFYRSEDVTDSLICYLGVSSGNLIYVSFARFAGVFSQDEETELRLIANTLANQIQ